MPENQNPEQSTEIHLFTDGGCSGNPGPGGWGFILRSLATGKEIERSGGSPHTTNNQMELEAVIQGLCTLTSSCGVAGCAAGASVAAGALAAGSSVTGGFFGFGQAVKLKRTSNVIR